MIQDTPVLTTWISYLIEQIPLSLHLHNAQQLPHLRCRYPRRDQDVQVLWKGMFLSLSFGIGKGIVANRTRLALFNGLLRWCEICGRMTMRRDETRQMNETRRIRDWKYNADFIPLIALYMVYTTLRILLVYPTWQSHELVVLQVGNSYHIQTYQR